MKRVFYEWGAITTSAVALLCFGYWVVLLYAPRASVEVFLPLGHWKSTQIVVAEGLVTINDHTGSKEGIEEVVKYRVVFPSLSKTRWALPGFLYQSIDWNGRLSWSLQFSLLIPAILFALAAACFAHGYLHVRQAALRAFLSKSRQGAAVTAAGS
jgi:hypothetical protein